MLICLDMRTGAGCSKETVDNAQFCEHCGQNLRFALMLYDAGTVVGRYRVVRVIGYGGFGAIYEALGAAGEQVALKETFDRSSISTFAREFAVLSQLSHANLPRYIEMFEAQGNGYLVMEYVPGQSLQEILDSQADLLPESQVLGYALQLCDVLHYLHSQQPPILHRDIKPANIRLMPQGRIKLVDFGLLKQGGQQTRATIRGLGTSGYAPIEQYADNQQATNPRSDVYALGATLYHLLSGKEPPSAPNRLAHPNNNEDNHENENENENEDEALPPLPAGLSPHLKEAIIKAMSVMPKERFADMQAFKEALQGEQVTDKSLQSTEMVAESFITLLTGQPTAQNKREMPVSSFDRATAWFKRSFMQNESSYVMPSSSKSLPHLPLNTNSQVLKVTFRSDGSQQTLIGMTKKGIIYQWRVPDGQLLRILSLAVPPEADVKAVAYSPTGDTVATTSDNYMIHLWRTEDGQLLHKLRGHGGLIRALAYAPTGNVLVSASNQDKLICFWHVATGQLLRQIDEEKEVLNLALSSDGFYLVGSNYNKSYLWRLTDNRLLQTMDQGTSEYCGVQWDSADQMLIYGKNKQVVVREPMREQSINTFEYDDTYFTGIAWHPDGKQMALGNAKGMIPIFTLGQKRPLYLCHAHKKRVLSLAYTPDGRFLASGGEDKQVFLWALDSASVPKTTFSYHEPLEVIESPLLNKRKAESRPSSAWWLPPTAPEQLSNYVEATHDLDLPHLVCRASGKVRTVGYVADGREVVGITEEGILFRWHVEDGQLIKKQPLLAEENQISCAAISPDGQTVALADKNLIVQIWRLADGKLLHQLRGHTKEIKALAYTPDGQVLASSGCQDNTIRFWRVADGKHLRTIKPKRETTCLKFSSSGQYLACGALHRVHILRIRDKRWICEIEKGCDSEHDISWSPDEKLLLCGDEGNVHIWRVLDGQEVMRFKGHGSRVKAVAWHPKKQLLLSGAYDNTVRIWSPLTPHLRHVSDAHKYDVRCVAFSPDGHTFASGGSDGAVRLWFLADNLDETLDHVENQPTIQASPITNLLETPIQEQPVAPSSTISQLKTAAPNSSIHEPSVWRKFGSWLTRQLLD